MIETDAAIMADISTTFELAELATLSEGGVDVIMASCDFQFKGNNDD